MRTSYLAALVAPLLLLAACDATAPAPTADALEGVAAPTADARPGSAGADGLAAARRATSHYHQVARAEADGWALGSPCVEHPDLGGMGYHYVNGGLMDGVLDPSAPEALLYEPQKNGRLRLVAVEYIVPFAASEEAPVLFGEEFVPGPPGWTLHAWVWKNNPAGTFADFNPDVTCDHAG